MAPSLYGASALTKKDLEELNLVVVSGGKRPIEAKGWMYSCCDTKYWGKAFVIVVARTFYEAVWTNRHLPMFSYNC